MYDITLARKNCIEYLDCISTTDFGIWNFLCVCRKYCANDSAKTITHSSAGVPQLTNTFRIELSNYYVVLQLHRISHLIFIQAFLEKQWRHQILITVLFSPPNNVFNGLYVLLWQTYKGNKLKDLSLWVLWPNQLIVLLCYGVTAGRHEKCNSTTRKCVLVHLCMPLREN